MIKLKSGGLWIYSPIAPTRYCLGMQLILAAQLLAQMQSVNNAAQMAHSSGLPSGCRECVSLLEELDAPVEHIVLGTHAYEHKIFVPPFQRRFPSAQVYVTPRSGVFATCMFVYCGCC